MGDAADDFNMRQEFEPSGRLYLVGHTLTGQGWMVIEMVETELPNAEVVAIDLTEEQAVAEAQRMTRRAMT